MLEGVLAPGGTASEVSIPGYQLAGKTGTASKVDPATGEYSKTRLRRLVHRLRAGVEPEAAVRRRSSTNRRPDRSSAASVAAPAFGQIMSFALPYLRIAAEVTHRLSRRTGQHLAGLTLDAELGDAPADARQRPRRRDHRARLRQPRRRGRGRCSSACPGFTRDGHDFAADAVAARRRGARRRAPAAASACPRSQVAVVRAAMAPLAARFYGDPTARAAVVGVTGHQRQDDHVLPRRASCSRPAACRPRLLGTVKSVIGGVERDRRAHDARGDRPAGATFARDARRPATAPARWRSPRTRSSCGRAGRDPLRRRDLHEPDAGPPRLPSDAWRTTSWPSGGCSAGRRPAPARGGQRRRPVRPPAGRRVRRRDDLRRRRRRRLRATDVRCGFDGCALHARRAATARASTSRRRCRAASTSPTRSARSPSRARSASS